MQVEAEAALNHHKKLMEIKTAEKAANTTFELGN
jgi:hypothetical protein